ncbi:hypothetical protein Golax_021305 [Gossypium laxum]|uniref:Uncharacterized protein n=2 Tax=Gossypium TaxID=3633 RepID=A0A7J8Y9C2_GOSAI|nr:hypothetical protein [Gossypium aridum]MBA0724628.1 hypothetical protein [Gossypium laxum]
MGRSTSKKHDGVPTPVIQPIHMQLSFICSKQPEQVRVPLWRVECSERCTSPLTQRPVGEQISIFSVFHAICCRNRSWAYVWWHHIPVFLGSLCGPSCLLVPSWYLLF